MIFKEFSNQSDSITSGPLNNLLNGKLRSDLANQVINLFNSNKQSPLVQYIENRLKNPNIQPIENFVVNKVSQFNSYKKDPGIFAQLLEIHSADVGKGEVLLSLIAGKWEGGSDEGYDVLLPKLGKIELKFLDAFSPAANVACGSSFKKVLEGGKFLEIIKKIATTLHTDPSILKSLVSGADIDYILKKSFDEVLNGTDISHNTIMIFLKCIKTAESKRIDYFSKGGITYKDFSSSIVEALHNSVGDVDHVMFLGKQIGAGSTQDGLYFILPKASIRPEMLYRVYDNRVKIAPFERSI